MSVIKKEAYFRSSTGVNMIRTLIWYDDSVEAKAVFQISHGVSEHIERYDDFARFLTAAGFVVCGNDHIGHGKSVDSEDDLGFTAEKDGYKRFVDDMHILYLIMHKRYPDLPYFLFGHSMGSMCARVYASIFGKDLAGLIICGTGQTPGGLEFVPNVLDDIVEKFGAHTINKPLAASLNKFSSLMISDKTSDLDWLSFNKENVEKYANDPLCGFPMTLSGIRDLVGITILCSDKKWPQSVPQELPIFIISGAKDPVGFNGKAPVTVADNLTLTGHNVEITIYPNCRHEILNEDCREKVYYDILGWLNGILF